MLVKKQSGQDSNKKMTKLLKNNCRNYLWRKNSEHDVYFIIIFNFDRQSKTLPDYLPIKAEYFMTQSGNQSKVLPFNPSAPPPLTARQPNDKRRYVQRPRARRLQAPEQLWIFMIQSDSSGLREPPAATSGPPRARISRARLRRIFRSGHLERRQTGGGRRRLRRVRRARPVKKRPEAAPAVRPGTGGRRICRRRRRWPRPIAAVYGAPSKNGT